jgi:hypothetical protein
MTDQKIGAVDGENVLRAVMDAIVLLGNRFKTRAEAETWITNKSNKIAVLFKKNKWVWFLDSARGFGIPLESDIAQTLFDLLDRAEKVARDNQWVSTGRLGVRVDNGRYSILIGNKLASTVLTKPRRPK